MKDQNKSFPPFFEAMKQLVPPDARIVASQFRGDPNDDIPGKWKARVVSNPEQIDDYANVYLCVSAMRKNSRGEFRRRKENFAGGLLLMIDDLGDGAGSKWPLSTLDPLQPTALIETSPGNYQAMYFFKELVTDIEEFDALIRAFIQKEFLGNDTGQAGVNRVFRPPAGLNGKAKHIRDGHLWRVRMTEWNPELRYTVAEIAAAFGLTLAKAVRKPLDENLLAGAKADRIRAFVGVRAALRAAGMIKREEADYSGWIQVRCPWTDEHSDRADTGAAIRLPEEENQWFGAFRCHHGHCEGKGWREVTDWLAESQAEVLALANAHAREFKNYKLV